MIKNWAIWASLLLLLPKTRLRALSRSVPPPLPTRFFYANRAERRGQNLPAKQLQARRVLVSDWLSLAGYCNLESR